MLIEVLDAVIVLADDAVNGHQIAGQPPFGDAEEDLLRLVHHLIHFLGLLVSQGGDLPGGGDESAADAQALHDAPVVLDVDGRGNGIDEASDLCRATDLLQLTLALQLLAQGHEVGRFPPLVEVKDGLVDPAVLLAVEILGPQERSDPEDCVRVDEEGAQDRFLSLNAMRCHSLGLSHGQLSFSAQYAKRYSPPRSSKSSVSTKSRNTDSFSSVSSRSSRSGTMPACSITSSLT